ncbi:sigma 54-interacting transcriptional regulator [Sorangium cellulosum]|uniref:sigma 54-interacting transcriptional regulator n=1 Tax=Sorangium cellulosum TaxID=56 RepID=UPI0006779103|nr:sigma 54-interacting transcriptional regulator [Sorangium cellulosum]
MTIEPTASTTVEDDAHTGCHPGTPLQPYLFVVLHCDQPLAGGARHGLSGVDLVTIGRGAARVAARKRDGELRQLEIRLPGGTISSTHALLARSAEGWVLEDAQSKNGSFLNGERVTGATLLCDRDVIQIGPVFLRYRAALPAAPETAADLDTVALAPRAPGFATLSPQVAEQLVALERIARQPVTVLLLGETGTGKEVLARAVHALSGRAGPVVAVNCGGLPDSLLESQLFGHVKGAFTGAARDEPGTIRSANRGTLFLDEIGDLPLSAQAALLRVLQEREVVPVGGTRPVNVDLRIVAATHKPLDHMALRGEFRGDLLARLSGYRHLLAPLRERIEDLGVIVGDILRRLDIPAATDLKLSTAAGLKLLRHPWPLNIRELQQALSVAAALTTDGVIGEAHLPEAALGALAPCSPALHEERGDPEALRRNLVELLEKHQGKVTHVARDMGKARMQIHRWMQRFGIDPNEYRGG